MIEEFLHNQWVSHDNVIPNHRYDPSRGAFYLNSQAGLITYRHRKKPADEFRNKYVNRFESLMRRKMDGIDVTDEVFKLYREIKREHGVSYRANVRTRLKGLERWISSKLGFKTF